MSEKSLKEAFNIQRGEVVSLVGAGGKTTLMAALAQEITGSGGSVITTTTTKIFEWQASGEKLIVEADKDRMLELAVEALRKHLHITLSGGRLPQVEKLDGINPQIIDKLAGLGAADYIIVEADGAARRPLKAPNATEPVIPGSTSLVIAVTGIDALGKELNRENVFRPEIVSGLTGLAMGETITAEAIARLVVHSKGIAKGSPDTARIVPFISKLDATGGKARAAQLAQEILKAGQGHIKRVVAGQLQCDRPVVEIFQA